MHVLVSISVGLVLSVVLGIACWAEFSQYVPQSLANETEWLQLEAVVVARTHATSIPTRVGVLLLLHASHIYLCLPMLHLTKVAYGFWLGLGPGWLLCCAWELLLFAAYLACMPRSPAPAVMAFTRNSREGGHVLYDNAMLAVSSFPLHVGASLVLGGDVSAAEFLAANALVTVVLSLKNVLCGAILADSPEPATLGLLAVVLTASTLLPTFATVYVTTKGLLVAAVRSSETPSACKHGEDEKLCPAGAAPPPATRERDTEPTGAV